MSFAAAEENFHAGARHGLDAQALLARPRARSRSPSWCCAGCCRWRTRASTGGGSTPAVRDRLLGIIEQRCLTGRNGAAWQAATFHRLYDATSLDRHDVLRRMTREYIENMHSNEPVHAWD